MLKGKGPSCVAHHVKTYNPKHAALFAECDEHVHDLTKMCLKMLCISMALLIKKQLQDQLPGGKFHKPSPQILQETSKCPSTNLIAERDFAHLDRNLKAMPNISTIAVTGTVMFLNNQTCKWLKSLPVEKRDEYMTTARKQAKTLIKKDREKRKAIEKKLCEKMKKKQDDKEKRELKKSDATAKLVAKVTKSGGLWEDKKEMDKALEGLDDEAVYEKLADQLRLRKNITTGKCDHKLFHLTHKSQKLSTDTLKENMVTILSSAKNDKDPDEETMVVDTEILKEKVNEKVAAKRQELHKDVPVPTKKAKKMKSYVGKKFQHKYDNVDGNGNITSVTWYEGEIIRAFGQEHENCTYEVKYKGEEQLYEVEVQKEMAEKYLVITN